MVSVPFGLSVTGCAKKSAPVQYCNSGDSGPVLGQVAQIILSPNLATVGESLNYGQYGQGLSATAEDCKGNAVSVSHFTYASTSSFSNSAVGTVFADINPSTGQVCAGTWNRNVGGGVADYTTCTAPTNPSGFLAYVTATAQGAVSNAIPVYVHPPVTGVVLGNATPGASNGSCPAGTTDPGTDCCPNSTVGTPVTAPIYTGTGCVSQNKTGQLVARVYTGGNTLPANNITCQVGHLSYGAQNASNVVAIDQNGVATAQQPGSTAITATIAQSSTATNAGFFSTCSPASIALTVNGQSSATIPINNSLPLTATVLDTLGNPITGLSLEYTSTEPQTIPGGGGTITPIYPSTANITAVCQPSTCNPSGFSQIGVFGNGKPVTSNSVSVTATGQSSTVIYAGSLGTVGTNGQVAAGTGSQYLYTVDFTTNQPGSLIKLPYVPNSMVMTLSGQSIYLGSNGGLITLTTANNSVSTANQNITGTVLAVSPDASEIVVTDPVRQTISLYGGTGNLLSAYGGIGTRAVWSPDNQTVYVTTTTGTILEHGAFTDWQVASPAPTQLYNDVAVTVPSVGAYFAGPSAADGRSYCSSTTNIVLGNPPTASNAFLPLADSDTAAIMDRIAATNDGLHILGAHVAASGAPTFTDMNVTLPANATTSAACPTVIPTNYFKSAAFVKPLTTTGTTPVTVGAQAITGIVPSNNSALAFVTYNGTSGLLPYYLVPTQGSFGTLQYVTLSSGTAPLSGAFSTDNGTFYVGTAGDNLIHEITVTYPNSGTPTAVDSGTLTPQLPAASGTGFAPVNVITQHPKKAKA
jgi:hypothetical protein